MSNDTDSSIIISFADLIVFHKEQCRINGQSSSFASEKTALNFFKKVLRIGDNENLANYFTDEATCNKFLDRLDGQGNLSDATIKSYKSRLHRWRKSVTYIIKTQSVNLNNIPDIINAVLPQILLKKGLTKTAFVRECGITRGEFQNWETPGRSAFRATPLKLKRAAKLEEMLELPTGIIVTKLFDPGHMKYETTRADYLASRDLPPVTLNRVRYKPARLPPKIEDFFSKLQTWKTSKRVLSRLDGEHLNRKVKLGKTKVKGWRINAETGYCPTAEMYENRLKAFYGWIMLPKTFEKAIEHVKRNFNGPESILTAEEMQRLAPLFVGKGQSPDDVSVAQYVDPILQSEFMEWREKRTGKDKVDYINDARTLLAPDVGFLSQQVEYVWDYEKLNISPVHKTQIEWEERYVEASRAWEKKSAQWLRQLAPLVPDLTSAKIRVRRKLSPILASDDLIGILLRMIERHADTKPQIALQSDAVGATNLAIWHRDQLLLKMLMSNPLRNRNYREMTYTQDNTGNLYHKNGDGWRIRFNPEDFKNEDGAASDEYDVPLPQKIWPWIDTYVNKARPIILKGRKNVDQLFLGHFCEPFDARGLSSVIASLSKRFMPEQIGAFAIRSHAFRHIIATAWLRSHPEDYLTVALILHDRIQTVIDNYGHIKPADGIKRYNSWLSSRLT